MTFLDNKYTKCYFNIVEKASKQILNGYTEKHHIVPKSLGGSNDEINLVRFTAREHFICHRLLTKMVEGKSKSKMLWALHRMIYQVNKDQIRYIPNSRTFEHIKKEFYEALRKPRIITEEHRNNIIAENKKRKGIKRSDEIRLKMKIAKKKRDEKFDGPNKGRKFSEEDKICKFCSRNGFKVVRQHERQCINNPNRITA